MSHCILILHCPIYWSRSPLTDSGFPIYFGHLYHNCHGYCTICLKNHKFIYDLLSAIESHKLNARSLTSVLVFGLKHQAFSFFLKGVQTVFLNSHYSFNASALSKKSHMFYGFLNGEPASEGLSWFGISPIELMIAYCHTWKCLPERGRQLANGFISRSFRIKAMNQAFIYFRSIL